MAQDNQDVPFSQEQKARLAPGVTGPEMAKDTPYQEPQPSDDKQHVPSDYDGLQVLETPGLEVAPQQSEYPETMAQHHDQQYQQYPQYAEFKPWPQHSPQATSDAYPNPVTPGSTTLSPYSGDAYNHQYHGGHNPFGPHDGNMNGDGRICGMRKRVFWIILAIVIFAVVAAIAIGLGVGLGTRSNSSAASSTAITSLYTATGTFPAPTATATAVEDKTTIICPSANRTLYSLKSSHSGQKFLLFCGRDYSSENGATDMYQVNTTNFEDCLEECGGQAGCVSVGWGNYYGTNTCWLKSAVGDPNWSEAWYAAVAQ